MVIYKYILIGQEPSITLPRDAKFLAVGFQNEQLMIWVQLTAEMGVTTKFHFHVVLTGQKFDITNHRFIGTVQMPDYVVHVYEVMKS